VPRLVCGWGRTAPSRARLVAPRTVADVEALADAGDGRGLLARGHGRAYGDAAQNAGGLLLDMSRMNRISELDLGRGTVTAQAGISFDQLIRLLVSRGWFLPVTPGTRQVTLGGAIACDIHGKNHHHDGSLAGHVDWLELVPPGRGARRLLPGDDEFAATAGGMGLTGVVTAARMRLLPVPTAAMRVTTERAGDVDDLMARMAGEDHHYRYSVAWIDCLARGSRLGRGVLTRGNHAGVDELPAGQRAEPLRYSPGRPLAAPRFAPPGLLSRTAMRAFNAGWFRKAPRHDVSIQSLAAFFHPLDRVRGWNRLYGPRGLVQHQSVVPFGQEAQLRRLLELFSDARAGSFLAVLKRFGPGRPLLSFPRAGWTLAVDFPAGLPELGRLLDRADELVAAAGGRVYLAKDARLRPEMVEAMYPELPRWRAIRSALDPAGAVASDLGRRLGLVE
jgi:decaprenylphospho-beta-D-ribofuranose 2-oxidase